MDKTLHNKIEEIIKSSDIVLFMKGTPQEPRCGFSSTVAKILDILGVKFRSIDVLEDDHIREGIKEYSDWPTIPQLYIKGQFIGGCDIVSEMYATGELQALFAKKGIGS